MASETSGAYFTANAVVDATAAATFIPEIWSDEIIAAYKNSLKMGPLVKRMSFKGKKGDLLHIPKPIRGSANAKSEATAVTIQANLESELQIPINRHYEYSRLIEDIVDVQALSSLRRFYTDDAGYQLAKQVDTDIMMTATGWGSGTQTFTLSGAGTEFEGSAAYFNDAAGGTPVAYTDDTVVAADLFTDAFFRAMIKKLDDNDVPMDNRKFVIPPCLRSTIMGDSRYVSSDFRDPRTVQTGYIGSLYGIDVYVSSNCLVVEEAANNAVSSDDVRAAFLFHPDASVVVEQMGVRSQTQYKQEYLSTLYTADTLYGASEYRPEAGFTIMVPDV